MMNEIPNWMERYIPDMIEQWTGHVKSTSGIATKEDLILYRDTLPDSSYSFPNRHYFDINMNIKIEFLEILNKNHKLDKS